MRIFKNIAFDKWARKEGLSDAALKTAVDDLNAGRFEANLSGNVYKKRVASQGRGKSGGFRTLIACRVDNMAFFMYGFAKNKRSNISRKEVVALKKLANELLSYTDLKIDLAKKSREIIEVK